VYNGEETNKNASSQNRRQNRRAFDTNQITSLHVFLRRVSFMRHLKKICGPHKHKICGGNMRKYGRELLEANYPISFHRGRMHGECHSSGKQTIDVTKPNRKQVIETQIILQLASKMPIYAEKICDMRTLLKYAKNVAIAYSQFQSILRMTHGLHEMKSCIATTKLTARRYDNACAWTRTHARTDGRTNRKHNATGSMYRMDGEAYNEDFLIRSVAGSTICPYCLRSGRSDR